MKTYKSCLTLLVLCILLPVYAEDEESDYPEEAEVRLEIHDFINSEEGIALKKFVQTHFPSDSISMITQKVENEPFEAHEWLHHLFEIQGEYMHLLEHDPAHAELFIQFQKHEINTYIVAAKLEDKRKHKASSSEIRTLESNLKQALTQAFELKLKVQGNELENLKHEVSELETMLSKRKEAQDEIIERRFGELSGQRDYLEW